MSKKDETIIQDAIIKYLNDNRILHWRMSGASNMAGFPDLMVCYKGRFVAFEIKTADGKATFQQHNVITEIIWNGGYAFIVRSVDDVKLMLQRVDERING